MAGYIVSDMSKRAMTTLAAINKDHAMRNRGTGSSGGGMTQPAGGSCAIHDPGPKGKGMSMSKDTAIKGIKKLAAGRPDTAKGRNVE